MQTLLAASRTIHAYGTFHILLEATGAGKEAIPAHVAPAYAAYSSIGTICAHFLVAAVPVMNTEAFAAFNTGGSKRVTTPSAWDVASTTDADIASLAYHCTVVADHTGVTGIAVTWEAVLVDYGVSIALGAHAPGAISKNIGFW